MRNGDHAEIGMHRVGMYNRVRWDSGIGLLSFRRRTRGRNAYAATATDASVAG